MGVFFKYRRVWVSPYSSKPSHYFWMEFWKYRYICSSLSRRGHDAFFFFFSFLLALISGERKEKLDGFAQQIQSVLTAVQRSWEWVWTAELRLIWFCRPLISEGPKVFFLMEYSPNIPLPFARQLDLKEAVLFKVFAMQWEVWWSTLQVLKGRLANLCYPEILKFSLLCSLYF